jgi:hypothetical protein
MSQNSLKYNVSECLMSAIVGSPTALVDSAITGSYVFMYAKVDPRHLRSLLQSDTSA